MLSGIRRISARAWRRLAGPVRMRLAGWVFERDRDAPVRLRFQAHLAAALLLAALVAAGSSAVLWWALGQPRLSPQTPEPLTPSNLYNGIKIALAVVAGIGGLVALVVAYRKQQFAEQEHQREDTRLLTERFGKASEQLGSDKAAVRLAGVYAMASLADDWPEGRQMCIDVLCAYLRMPYTPPVDGEAADGPVEVDEETQQARLEERQVRHTIIRVITAHLRAGAPVSWQGYDFDFTGAVFDGGDFSHAVFSGGQVNFSGAKFSGGVVNFIGAKFSDGLVDFGSATFSGGVVNFFGAKFSGGVVNFFEAKFSDGQVNFSGATFSGSQIVLLDAKFSNGAVLFSDTTFSGSQVDFLNATFSGGEIDFSDAKFSGGEIDFFEATFSGGQVDFSSSVFSGSQVDFRHARFSGGRVDLRHAKFSGAPPVFDSWTDGPPDGLLFPPAYAAEDDGGSAGDADDQSKPVEK